MLKVPLLLPLCFVELMTMLFMKGIDIATNSGIKKQEKWSAKAKKSFN